MSCVFAPRLDRSNLRLRPLKIEIDCNYWGKKGMVQSKAE